MSTRSLSLLLLLYIACRPETPDTADSPADTAETDTDTAADTSETDTDTAADTSETDVPPVDWPWSSRLSVNDASDYILTGGKVNQRVGVSVAAADWDGDGADEVAVTGLATDAENKGRVYLVNGAINADISLTDNASARIIGANRDDYTGFTLAGAGDVDGDGYEDLAIGAPFVDKLLGGEGAVFLFTGPIDDDQSVTGASATFYGTSGLAADGTTLYPNAAGSALAAGDLNDDGRSDLIIGAFGQAATATDGPSKSTSLYILEGPVAGALAGKDADIQLTRMTGKNTTIGGSVATSDLNGDGMDDVIMGWPGDPDTGTAMAFLAPLSGWIDALTPDGLITGEGAGTCLGSQVAGVGDTNGDGFEDVLVAATSVGDCTDVGAKTAAAWLLLGPWTGSGTASATAWASFHADASTTGNSVVAGGGDVNADGLADLLVGLPGDTTGGPDTGSVFVWRGPITSGALDLSQATTQIQGAARTEKLGGTYAWTDSPFTDWSTAPSLVGDADVNDDGYGDFLLGAYGYGEGFSNEGAPYLVRGGGL